jgi:hypothetical protein
MGQDTVEELRWYAANAADPELIGGTVAEDGDVIRLEIKNDFLLNRYEFSKSSGFNLTHIVLKDNRAERSEDVAYERRAGTYIPVSFKSTLRVVPSSPGDRPEEIGVQVTFDKSVVNTALGPDAYRVESLGIKDGDTVHDKTIGLTYTYSSAKSK